MKRKKKIKAADLPLFDPAAYLGDEAAIAALQGAAAGQLTAFRHDQQRLRRARRPPGRTAGPLTVIVDLSATRRHSQPFSLKAERSTPGGAYQPSAP